MRHASPRRERIRLRACDAPIVWGYDAALAQDGEERRRLADPVYRAELAQALDAGREAKTELERRERERQRTLMLLRELCTIVPERQELPDRLERSFSERFRDAMKAAQELQIQESTLLQRWTPSYRSQGRTVDAVYVLATQADDRLELWMNASRAPQSVRIEYGRDEVTNFGSLLALSTLER